jgi:hypothetical protein
VDNSGISAQPTTGDGRSWTTCPLLRISPWYRWRGAVPAYKCLASTISIMRTYLRVRCSPNSGVCTDEIGTSGDDRRCPTLLTSSNSWQCADRDQIYAHPQPFPLVALQSCRRHFAGGGSAEHVPGGRAGVAARVHRPAVGVGQRRGVAGVVPDVPAPVPVAVGLGAGAVPGVDLDVAVGADGIGGEPEDVPGGVAQRPVGEADLRAGGVIQPDPLGIQAGVGAGVGAG